MRIIAVDDENMALSTFEGYLKEINQQNLEYLGGFTNPLQVMPFVRENEVDLVFLDLFMPGITGLELAKEIKAFDNDIRIVFLTGFDSYALEAFGVDAIGYLLKPYSKADLEKQIKKAALMSPKSGVFSHRLYMRTMPRFDMFVEDSVVHFHRQKSKELLAYLVNKRGSTASMEEIIGVLWENRPYSEQVKVLYREAIMSLRRILESHNAEDIFLVYKGICCVDTTKFDCDYYELLNGNRTTMSSFSGQYMFEYSWAEETTAAIENLLHEKEKN